ncbi:Uncharacterised protein [Bordetella pertussis]|nr:Uncharacterised protein [Bordetella pertussis]CFM58882.1 Uncharacterised protein [Bordetella pertussis]CFN07301.1 Uncharacterised protein [Bordetella pertussis]CFN19411.1 Uncharacterised protein [Bordetella pertussis]CFN48559.1 Uncharacterised protein [Bordetella pertussis]
MCPSAGACSTARVPTTPSAPALFSTSTVVPHSAVSLAAMKRATASAAVPAV